MTNAGSWGGLMGIYDDCMMLLDDGAGSAPVSAPWISHDPFDINSNSVCPGQLVLGQDFPENGYEIKDVDSLQSPSESSWETVYDSDSEGSEFRPETFDQDDDMDESVVGFEIWDEFMSMMESRDTSHSESMEVYDRLSNGKQDEKIQEVILLDSVEVGIVVVKDEEVLHEVAPREGSVLKLDRPARWPTLTLWIVLGNHPYELG
ncbi:hypothetical protein DL95DRAFT_406602 [Leptodontidium sp. 2 PMI_412]|nr:hypothetical protein DL95DRAFT_406602 [Leptodontidium sp. 2 PMI_412]